MSEASEKTATPNPEHFAAEQDRMVEGFFISGKEDQLCPYPDGSPAEKWWKRGEAAALAEGALNILIDGLASGDLDNAVEQAIANLESAAH